MNFAEYKELLIAWAAMIGWVVFVIAINKDVHPRVLFKLFMVELWERFSYYGMRAFLVLYLTAQTAKAGIGMEKFEALGVYAAYGALVYLTPLLGGFIADKYFGFKKSIIWGAILMAAGQFTLSAGAAIADPSLTTQAPNEYLRKSLLYAGLSLLVIGNGFFKPNISSLVGKFYGQGDSRRAGAFTIFYMGINIGAFLAPLTCGKIAEVEGWQYGFLCAGIGMVVGLILFLYTAKSGTLEHHADAPSTAAGTKFLGLPSNLAIYIGTFALVPIACMLIHYNEIMDYLLATIGVAAIGYMIVVSFRYPRPEMQKIWVIVVLFFFTIVFWTFFELAGSALNLFTQSNVNKTLFKTGSYDLTLTTSQFQSANALFIILLAPVFSTLWIRLARINSEPNSPIKFAFGLVMVGAGFLVLNLGKGAAVGGLVPAMFLILLYLMHTLGELALSPVGLSLVTQLAPAKMVGFMMGFWFLAVAIAHQAGKWVAAETVAPKDATPEQTLDLALAVFNNLGLFAIGCGVVLVVLSPLLKKWMHGVK